MEVFCMVLPHTALYNFFIMLRDTFVHGKLQVFSCSQSICWQQWKAFISQQGPTSSAVGTMLEPYSFLHQPCTLHQFLAMFPYVQPPQQPSVESIPAIATRIATLELNLNLNIASLPFTYQTAPVWQCPPNALCKDHSYHKKDSCSALALRSYFADHMSQFHNEQFCIYTDVPSLMVGLDALLSVWGAVNKWNTWQRALYSQQNWVAFYVACSLLTKYIVTPLLSSATLVVLCRWLNTMTPHTHWYTKWLIGYIDCTSVGKLFVFTGVHVLLHMLVS